MANTTKHPHQSKPSNEDMVNLLKQIRKDANPAIIDAFMALHQCIIDTLPEISFEMDLTDGQAGYGARQYGYDGWGMVALAHHKNWVNLHFMKGAQLSAFDEAGMLEGKGKQLRHMKFFSLEDVAKLEGEIRILLRQAATLHGE